SEGVDIYYEDTGGAGPPIVLVHGFASGLEVNWKLAGWIAALIASGRRVIALDCRGHGKSSKPHDPTAYGDAVMSRDVLAVMDAAGVDAADVVGYSMGSTIVLGLLTRYPHRLKSAVLGGFGLHDPKTVDAQRFAAADALAAPDPESIADPAMKGFRRFLEQSGQDVLALAACMRGQSMNEDETAIKLVGAPVLLVCGDNDEALPGAQRLVSLLPDAGLTVVPGANHLTAVGSPVFREAVLSFLARQSS
ncbi:MAG TPA: alpha/beta hydrolase, partial [Dehalococcoidia bacterium]